MKRIFLMALCLATFTLVVAQPPRRRTQTAEPAKTANAQKTTKGASYRTFPVAQTMPQDAAWRRDIYRELDLTKDENAPLYYPIIPQGDRMSLFTYIFKLMLRGQVKAYKYRTDGNEHFEPSNVDTVVKILNRYKIFYETNGDRIRVNDVDLPTEDVKHFFIKESVYYDQHTSTFRSKVTALCPVLSRGNEDYGNSWTRWPMFWIKYEDVAPYLGKLMLSTSNLNNAASMSADDYFTQNLYKGDIYRSVNLQDRLLVSDESDTTQLRRSREAIERQISDFEKHVWRGDTVAADTAVADSLDAGQLEVTIKKRTVRRSTSSRRSSSADTKATTRKSSQPKQKATRQRSSGGGYSVRKQRH